MKQGVPGWLHEERESWAKPEGGEGGSQAETWWQRDPGRGSPWSKGPQGKPGREMQEQQEGGRLVHKEAGQLRHD